MSLWEDMVLYQQNPIKSSYIPDLRKSFKAYDAASRVDNANTAANSSILEVALSKLRNPLFGCNTEGTTTIEKSKKLIVESYYLSRTKLVEEVLYSSPTATSKSRELWVNICMLSRLRVAFNIFKDIYLVLPSFTLIKIILIPHPPNINPS
jgi:hypothetical protein